jgi:hypothetical protein
LDGARGAVADPIACSLERARRGDADRALLKGGIGIPVSSMQKSCERRRHERVEARSLGLEPPFGCVRSARIRDEPARTVRLRLPSREGGARWSNRADASCAGVRGWWKATRRTTAPVHPLVKQVRELPLLRISFPCPGWRNIAASLSKRVIACAA